MRTTIDLPDELVRAARIRAAERDETLKELFERALTKELGRAPRVRGPLPVVTSSRPGTLRLTNEMIADLDLAADLDRVGHPDAG